MAALTEEQVQEILDLYKKLGTASAVADETGREAKTVRKYLRRAGFDIRNNAVTVTSSPVDEDAFVERVEAGASMLQLMEEFSIGHNRAKKLFRRHRLDLPKHMGRVTYREPVDLPLPKRGEIKRYILTSAQNNTPIHEQFWENLKLAADDLKANLMVARYTYDKSSYRSGRAVKVGRGPTQDDLAGCWYDDRLEPYFCDGKDKPERYRLAPGLVWCSEMNILPTNEHPLASLEGYTRRESGIFPHAKLSMRSVASMQDEAAKFNWTTGTVTQRNYIQKLTGLKAEFWHSYCALLVEVDAEGNWWVFQLEADEGGTFYFFDRCYAAGAVTRGHVPVAINWGDVHADEVEEEVLEICEEILDDLRPCNQFMHDILSFRRQGHHERKVPSKQYAKFLMGELGVAEEVAETVEVANRLNRDFCTQYIVSSNHDRHGERWLDEADWRQDLQNAKHFFQAWLARIEAMEASVKWTYAEWAMRDCGLDPDIVFLDQRQSFEIAGIEKSLHGDEGPNGARGSTRNLTKLGRKVTKGHDHQATIDHDVWSAGACHLAFDYMTGPGSHSITHVLTYPNGSRTMITVWDGKYRA